MHTLCLCCTLAPNRIDAFKTYVEDETPVIHDCGGHAGLDVWALDLLGLRHSDREPAMAEPAEDNEPYLDTDPDSRARDPHGVKVPSAPFVEILRAWHGELAYDPGLVRSPLSIVRGEWDGLTTDADARWLFDAFSGSPDRRDVKLGRGTHSMHGEAGRGALWQASAAFPRGPA